MSSDLARLSPLGHHDLKGFSDPVELWRVEGIDIVNPNHLSNAGTFSDRRAASGGSQSVLSTQVLDNSQFLTGAFPANYGNTIGGAFDMQLRTGNNQQREYTVQAGLIGLEFAAEGPFTEGGEVIFFGRSELRSQFHEKGSTWPLDPKQIKDLDIGQVLAFHGEGILPVFGVQAVGETSSVHALIWYFGFELT